MVYLLLAEGFEECEALLPLDLLRRGGVTVQTVGITGKTVLGSHGIQIIADITAEEAVDTPELLILPGGLPGTTNLDESPVADALIKKVLNANGRLAAICAAPLILGKRGILEGKNAICYPGFENYLSGAKISDSPVVTDGNVTTAKGMGVAFEFGAELLALLTSKERANEITRATQYAN